MPVVVGDRFTKLVAAQFICRDFAGAQYWLCNCDCGGQTVARGHSLQRGDYKSCGCLKAELVRGLGARNRTHGVTGTSIYLAWKSMITRCYYQKYSGYKNYGGRGITVCDRWRTSFENFLADVGQKPTAQHSLDRINNDGHYEPSNVRWATRTEQNRNTRRNKGEARG